MSTSIDNYKNLEYVQKILSENLENVLYLLIEEKGSQPKNEEKDI